ncbi:hypothetical protein [Aliidiomarina sanyensis]|uniref:Uncharacterized protein n=1 Tax=Aliidiomarina sanyensis TaxID=1249555 RepID=A0A432WGS5_9GAMM|nr:hypothetical protein [Aliidiomarina sanyensis]RUO32889.1 hypothetical protein CWE11_07620 [Aliidiomarina sanyensis]
MVTFSLVILLISFVGFISIKYSPDGGIKIKRTPTALLSMQIIVRGVGFSVLAAFFTYIFAHLGNSLAKFSGGRQHLGLQTSLNAQAAGFDVNLTAGHLLFLLFLLIILFLNSKAWQHLSSDHDDNNIERHTTNEMEKLFLGALRKENETPLGTSSAALLRVNLDNRKVYIGNLIKSDLEQGELENIVIVPFYSGYLDESTLELTLTEFYREHYTSKFQKEDTPNQTQLELFLEQYAVTIPASKIISASMFQIDVFTAFLDNKTQRI